MPATQYVSLKDGLRLTGWIRCLTSRLRKHQKVSGAKTNRNAKIGSYHSNGVNVGMFDGFVRRIPVNIDLDTWKALFTISGGEEVTIP
ncbi:MAG: DUF1559 domain-containing protein [Thermoguttaceae bacterium]